MARATGVSMNGTMIYIGKKKKKKGRYLCNHCGHYSDKKCTLIGHHPESKVCKCYNFINANIK